MVNSEISIPPLSISHPNLLLLTTIMQFFGILFQICSLQKYLAYYFFSPLKILVLHIFLYHAYFIYQSVFKVCHSLFIQECSQFFSPMAAFIFNPFHQHILFLSFPLQTTLQCAFVILFDFAKLPSLLSCMYMRTPTSPCHQNMDVILLIDVCQSKLKNGI